MSREHDKLEQRISHLERSNCRMTAVAIVVAATLALGWIVSVIWR